MMVRDARDRSIVPILAGENPGAIFAPIAVAAPTGANTCASKPSATGITEGNILFCRGLSQAQVNSALGFLTNLTGQIGRTGDQLILLPKIDWNITSKHHASFTYNRLRWASPAGTGPGCPPRTP